MSKITHTHTSVQTNFIQIVMKPAAACKNSLTFNLNKKNFENRIYEIKIFFFWKMFALEMKRKTIQFKLKSFRWISLFLFCFSWRWLIFRICLLHWIVSSSVARLNLKRCCCCCCCRWWWMIFIILFRIKIKITHTYARTATYTHTHI